VIAVFRTGGRLHDVVVLDELGIPLVRLAPDEAVEAVVAQAERPGFPVRADVERIDGHVVILADPERAPARLA